MLDAVGGADGAAVVADAKSLQAKNPPPADFPNQAALLLHKRAALSEVALAEFEAKRHPSPPHHHHHHHLSLPLHVAFLGEGLYGKVLRRS